jgi:uncharacterized membrane protein
LGHVSLGLPMFELLPPLNDKNLPWLDVIHPIVVHFVIAMALITVVFDLIGVVTRKKNLFEVSFWNLIVATVAIFVAIIFGQIEAGLANPYGASRDILNYHSTIGWSLAGVLALLTGWRDVARQKAPNVLPKGSLPSTSSWRVWCSPRCTSATSSSGFTAFIRFRWWKQSVKGCCHDPVCRDCIADQRHRRLARR